jgi:hypothetical protein
MTVNVILFGAGAILIIIAIIGGGFEIKEIRLPPLSRSSRILATIAGICFITLGIWIQQGGGDLYSSEDLLSGHWIGTTSDHNLTVEMSLMKGKDDKDYQCSISVGQIIEPTKISKKKSAEEETEESCTITVRGTNVSVFSKVNSTDSETGWDPDDFELQLKNGQLVGHLISHRETSDISFKRL